MQRHHRLGSAVLVLALLGPADTALADHNRGHRKKCVAAVCQYVEHIPTGSGSQPTSPAASGTASVTPSGTKPGAKARAPLAPRIRRKLERQAGKDARLLEQIATSSAYGAPQVRLRRGSEESVRGDAAFSRPRIEEDPSLGQALSAAVTVAGDASNGRVIGLLVFMAGITAIALGAAGYQRRTLKR